MIFLKQEKFLAQFFSIKVSYLPVKFEVFWKLSDTDHILHIVTFWC